MDDYKKMAELIASKLTDEELRELLILMDGDIDNQLLLNLDIIGMERVPDLYA